MHLESSSEFKEVIEKLNNSEFLDPSHRIMISTRSIDMGVLVESIKNTKHNVIALTINSIKLTGDEIEKLEDVFTHCTSLENLDLSNNDFTSKEAEILAGILANNKTVKSLSLNNNKIGDNGLKAFAKIAENSSIENLNFSDNNISDIGFKYWAETLKKNTSLTNFNFHNNKIHNEGIQTLIHFLKFNDSVKSFHVGTERVEEPNTTNVTLETHRLLTKLVEEKEIEAFLKTSDTLLPDALDVWVEEVIPALQLKPTEQLSNHEEAGSVTNETTPQQEIIVGNKFNPETTLELLDKYGKKFKTALEKGEILDKLNIKPNPMREEEQKALIILGNPGSGKTTLANLFATETLAISINKKGKLLKLKDSLGFSLPLDYSSSNKAVINIAKPDPNLIICESNYLHDELSTPEKIINEFYITKILSNYPTKFIVTIKDSELENGFVAITGKLFILLKNIPLISGSLYLVVTDVPTYKNSDHIFYTLVDIIRNTWSQEKEALGKKQIDIVDFLAEPTSRYIFPTFSPGTIGLGEFKKILDRKFPPLIKEDNKIAVGSTDISYILTLQSSIQEGLRDGISKLSDKIKTKWEKEKASLFILGTKDIRDGWIIQPNTEALKKLQDIFEWLKKLGNDSSNNNIIDNDTAKFLALNNVLYEVLRDKESSELNVKLSSYIDYLKYFTAISADNRENISTNMHDNWFKMLADGVLSIGDINKQLVESFKTAMQDFFPCRLKAFLGELSNPTKILGEDTIKNIYSLKLLQSILADKDINNFTIIKHMLNITSPTGGVDLAVDLLKTNIAVLKKLVIERDPDYVLNILTERWQKFVDLKPIKDINENIHIIYEKLMTLETPIDIKIYYKLIALKDIESADLSDLHIKDCCPELVESYCKMGSVGSDGAELFESYNPLGNTVDSASDFIG